MVVDEAGVPEREAEPVVDRGDRGRAEDRRDPGVEAEEEERRRGVEGDADRRLDPRPRPEGRDLGGEA